MIPRLIATAALAVLTILTIGCGREPEQSGPGGTITPVELNQELRNELREEIRSIVQEELQAQLMELTPPEASTPEQKPEPAANTTERPPDLRAGICPRSTQIRQELMEKLGQNQCGQVTPDHLYSITHLQVTTQKVRPKDFQDLFNLQELLVDGLTQPLEPGTFSNLHNLKELQIYTIKSPTQGGNLLQPGTFSGLGSLRSLSVSSEDGWTAFQLSHEIMQGMPELEKLDINYISSVTQSALLNTRNLREIRLHVKRSQGESYGRVPKSIFAQMPQLQKVHIQNLRWPPVLNVAGREAACAAREWTSSAGGNGHTTPLSVRVGKKPATDLESLEGCP